MDITQNYFEIFGLPAQYDVDLTLLADRYRALQREYHPDRFAGASAQERRRSVQLSAHVNEGFATLKSPVKRARYLLQLHGIEFDEQRNTTHDGEFLMQQMELREALADAGGGADPLAALQDIERQVDGHLERLRAQFAAALSARDGAGARDAFSKMQFMAKLRHEIELREGELLDSL